MKTLSQQSILFQTENGEQPAEGARSWSQGRRGSTRAVRQGGGPRLKPGMESVTEVLADFLKDGGKKM